MYKANKRDFSKFVWFIIHPIVTVKPICLLSIGTEMNAILQAFIFLVQQEAAGDSQIMLIVLKQETMTENYGYHSK